MTATGELWAVTSHSTLLPVIAALYTRMVPLELEEGRARRQGSKQVLSAQQPCWHTTVSVARRSALPLAVLSGIGM